MARQVHKKHETIFYNGFKILVKVNWYKWSNYTDRNIEITKKRIDQAVSEYASIPKNQVRSYHKKSNPPTP